MSKFRYPLQNQLWNAFTRTIREDYEEQLINSENGMLAAFDRHLRLEIPKARRIFIEPRVFDGKDPTRRWFPDMVVCNSREVIAVLEMKYTPRGLPKYERDIEKLKSIAKLRKRLHVANTRYLGVPVDDREYTFSAKTLFLWVGVQRRQRLVEHLPLDRWWHSLALRHHHAPKYLANRFLPKGRFPSPMMRDRTETTRLAICRSNITVQDSYPTQQ